MDGDLTSSALGCLAVKRNLGHCPPFTGPRSRPAQAADPGRSPRGSVDSSTRWSRTAVLAVA